jgi:muramidase (phage lysozyme)
MTLNDLIAALASPNVAAFLRCLRHGESTQDEEAYRWLFGSTRKNPKLFESFADHPRIRTYEKYDGQFIKNGKIDFTTAAGAYQIVASTWDPIAKKYGLKDFSPDSQDLAAVGLIAGRGALDDVMMGRFETALNKCRKEWASLPGAGYGQPEVKLSDIRAVYERYGGAYTGALEPTTDAGTAPEVTTTEPEAPTGPLVGPEPKKESWTMAPFVGMALTALMNAVPDLMKLFGSGSKVSERNTKVVETVVNLAKNAIGATNEQQLVEALADPEAVVKVQAAIRDNWYQIQEVGGGIVAAREASIKVQGTNGLLANPAFLISLILLMLPMLLLIDVFFVHPDNYSSDGLRTQIVTGVLMVISMIGGFWLGTSFSSGKKDDAIIDRMK